MNPTCSRCRKPSSALQTDIFSPQQILCIDCLTQERAEMMMKGLPDPDDWEYTKLSAWEKGFLSSVRQQFKRKKSVSEPQYQSLEKLWDKMNK